MTDRDATQEFEIRNILANHCGERLSPDKVEQIVREIVDAMRTGPCSWAFKQGTDPIGDANEKIETVTIPKADYEQLLEALEDVVNQACFCRIEKYGDHLFTYGLSANESGLYLLEDLGRVEELAYGRYRWKVEEQANETNQEG